MMTNTPSLDLVEFVETNILPQYTQFDRAHNLEHVTRVIRNALDLVRTTGADINMVYTIAAYHDLGMSGPRAIHHVTSGKILAADARLRRWFSTEQIKIMKEAQRFCQHMDEKYSVNGYIRLWIPGSQNEQQLNKLRRIIADKQLLREAFEKACAAE